MEDDGFQTLTLQGSSTEGARRIEVAARAEGLSKISFGVLKAKAHELGPEGLQRTAEVLLGPQRAEGPASLGEELGHGTHHVSRFRFESLPNDRVQSILCHRGILLCAAGCLSRSNAGIVTFEANFGMAKSFRRAVESGQIHHTENS